MISPEMTPEITPETIEVEVEIKVKKVSNRRKPDGSYDNKPTDPHYFRDYYRNKLSGKCPCDVCGKDVVGVKLKRHQQTNTCHIIGDLRKQLAETTKTGP